MPLLPWEGRLTHTILLANSLTLSLETPAVNAFTHPHLAMQVPHLYDTPTLLAIYAECAPWCETATLKAMQDEIARRGVAIPTLNF